MQRSCSPQAQGASAGSDATIDQTLAPNAGLPGRPWFKNLVYAPGRYTGYGAKTLPGVREAIEDERWDDANKYAKITADALNAYSAPPRSGHRGAERQVIALQPAQRVA